MSALRPSPFGLDECCICDRPALYASPTEDGELLPYCANHLRELRRQFPDVDVYTLVELERRS